jgi:putative copper export protein
VANLFQQPYGRWLLAKITLFCLMAGIGAVNLLRIKPRLLAENLPTADAESNAARLQFNVWLELFIGIIIIVIVAILGLLPPAISAQG